jgi:ATP-binding cassette, subfamily B, bacterial PglK
MTIFFKVIELMNKAEKKHALTTLVAIFVMAALDTAGVASIMPFIALLSNPEEIQSNKMLSFLYFYFDFNNQKHFLFFIGCCVFSILLSSLAFKALVTYLQLRFSFLLEHSLSNRLFGLYLNQPYIWFLDQNTSSLSKSILSEVQQLINFAVIPGMYALANGAISIGLIAFLIFIEPQLTLISTTILGVLYFSLYGFSKKFLDKIGHERTLANEKRFQIVGEAFSAITEVKVGVFENIYNKKYKKTSLSYARVQSASQIVAQLPRYGLEICVFGGMILVLLFLINNGNVFISIIPTLAVMAFAAYRLIPALQHVYSGISHLRYSGSLVIKIKTDLESLERNIENKSTGKKIKLKRSINLTNITFSYPKSLNIACKNINANINANTVVGLSGISGSGKSTLARIILGILKPHKGCLTIDDIEINSSNVGGWKTSVGYVPQNIYLAQKTVAENIAFNVPSSKIDFSRIVWASKLAGLHNTVENLFVDGYQTMIGEKGQKISGGQNQRIAIARALYHKPELLIFDEATSALDATTENNVLNALIKLKEELTVVIITHRLITLKLCDKIFFLKNGEIMSEGKFDDLLEKCPDFKTLSSM